LARKSTFFCGEYQVKIGLLYQRITALKVGHVRQATQLRSQNQTLFSEIVKNDKIARFLLQLHYAVAFLHFLCYHNVQRCRVLSSLGGIDKSMDALPGGRAFCISGGKHYGGKL